MSSEYNPITVSSSSICVEGPHDVTSLPATVSGVYVSNPKKYPNPMIYHRFAFVPQGGVRWSVG